MRGTYRLAATGDKLITQEKREKRWATRLNKLLGERPDLTGVDFYQGDSWMANFSFMHHNQEYKVTATGENPSYGYFNMEPIN